MANKFPGLYILDADGTTPIACPNIEAWAWWMDTSPLLSVAVTHTAWGTVSTIFLGVSSSPDPLLWQTLIIGGRDDGYCEMYRSHADALTGHANAVGRLLHDGVPSNRQP